MSDDREVTDVPAPDGAPDGAHPKKSLLDRYGEAATWVKVAIPVVAVAVLVGIGALIAALAGDDSSTDSSTTASTISPSSGTALILVATASQLAGDPTASTTVPDTTTTEPTTTTVETTVPTTEPAVPTTEPGTVPPATTVPSTTTTEPPTTTEKATTTTVEEETEEEIDLPAGEIAESPDAFMAAWNTAAAGSGVASISSWTQQPFAGQSGSVADLGGNVRVVLLSDEEDGPVAEAVLAWLPLSDPDEEEAQNEAYRQAFDVLMETVDADVTSAQQKRVATQLGLSSTEPPFPEGTTASVPQGEQQYDLMAIEPEGRSGIYTLIGASKS